MHSPVLQEAEGRTFRTPGLIEGGILALPGDARHAANVQPSIIHEYRRPTSAGVNRHSRLNSGSPEFGYRRFVSAIIVLVKSSIGRIV
jgi:hypothetical protein